MTANITTYTEDDLLPISRFADLLYCERRAALHLVERVWTDNVFTAEGTVLHERVHDQTGTESRGDVRVARGLRLRSLKLGLSGVADVVEFVRLEDDDLRGVRLSAVAGRWRVFPIEYKRGSLKHEPAYEVQLCAQSLCLEEMLGANIDRGAVYFGQSARRLDVLFTDELRARTEEAARRMHVLVEQETTPPPHQDARCDSCSLVKQCLPKACRARHQVGDYLTMSLREISKVNS
jgi:CRISPR-associated exonuclease Cas4